jgi:hypothetical protein
MPTHEERDEAEIDRAWKKYVRWRAREYYHRHKASISAKRKGRYQERKLSETQEEHAAILAHRRELYRAYKAKKEKK